MIRVCLIQFQSFLWVWPTKTEYFDVWNSQPKPIDRPKWLEINWFQCISVLVDFWFSKERVIEKERFFCIKWRYYWKTNTVKTQTLFSTQNTKQHIKNHKTQTKISSYKVSLKQTSRDDTKPMESQYKHRWFRMRETKSRIRHTIARNEETESVQAWVIWDERQNQEEDIL